jgi:hypothetical protein
MDRPDYFVTIPDSDDALDRMLNVIKWWFSKDTKWMVYHYYLSLVSTPN